MPRRLPQRLRRFFLGHDFASLSWKSDRNLIIGQLLAYGDWKSLRWLRRRLPDAELREWLIERQGANLGKRHLRFWELILDIPRRQVNAWIALPGRDDIEAAFRIWAQQWDFWLRRNDD